MARISRKSILEDYGYYHVIARGNGKRALFRYNKDYEYFINTTKQYINKFQINIYHYCLMSNHIHFLIQPIKAMELPIFMQRTLQKYAIYFRNKYDSPGHIFQNRYQCYLIDKDSYLLDCARYIERNPLKAGIVKDISQYPWSSFNFYANGKKDILISNENPAYSNLGQIEQQRQKNYIEYIFETRPSDLIER